MSTLRIAWRNLGRNRKRSLLALGAIAVGQLAFLGTAALIRGYGEEFLDSVTGPLVGHIQVHAADWRDERAIDLTLNDLDATLAEIRRDSRIAGAAPRLFAPVLVALTEDGFMGMVVGVDPAAESHGRGLMPGGVLAGQLGGGRVLVGRGFARKHDIAPGMEIAVVGQDADGSIANDLFTVSGIIPSPVDVVSNLGIVMSLDDARELLCMPDQAHEIVIHVHDAEVLESTVAQLAALPLLAEAEILPWQEIAPHAVTMIAMMDVYLFIVLIVVLIAAAAGIANTMLMSTFERRHEFGMLLSLGCGPGRLSRIVGVEGVILGQLGVAIGTVLGLTLVLLTAETGIDYAALGGSQSSYQVAYKGLEVSSRLFPQLYVTDVIAGSVAVLLVSLVSIIWPVLHIVRLEPMEALRS